MTPNEAVHHDPVWRERSNFIIGTWIETSETDVSSEQLWCRDLGAGEFELCCIPFFAYDLCLGDVVEVDGEYMVTRVKRASGRYVFRVYFGEARSAAEAALAEVETLGGLVERFTTALVAVDAEDRESAQAIADYLQTQEDRGLLQYETGRTR